MRLLARGLLVLAGLGLVAGGRAAGERGARVVTGQCLCGRVTYVVEGPILDCNYCDCRGCQRASGALKTPWVVMPRAGLKVTGEVARIRGDKARYDRCEEHGERTFCPHCGSNVFWLGDRGETVDLTAGCLDDPSLFKPKE